MKVTAVLAGAAALCGQGALADSASLRAAVKDALTAGMSVGVDVGAQAAGVQNCLTKCALTFDNTAYAIQTVGGQSTYEYAACAAGCRICTQQLSNPSGQPSDCFTTCKDTNWLQMQDAQGNPIQVTKGIIEPDKACIMGCIINTCQVVCTNGTPDITPTAANAQFWWNPPSTDGCSIKTGFSRPDGYYAQSSKYNFWNSPAGSGGQQDCCSQAMNLCQYKQGTHSQAYKNSLHMAQKKCANVPGVGAGASYPTICTWSTQQGNCGSSPTR